MNGKSIGIVAVVLVLLLGAGIYLATRDSDDQSASTNTSQQTAAESNQSEPMNEASAPTSDIVELAVATDDLSTLVTAVQAAGLADTLKGEGPFTVFAPTNAAFEKLPAGTLDSLLLPENKDQLTAILTYHVVPAKAMSSDLSDGQQLKTVQGGILTVSISNGVVTLTDAKGGTSKVVTADVEATNGVVHVIDTVVMPQ